MMSRKNRDRRRESAVEDQTEVVLDETSGESAGVVADEAGGHVEDEASELASDMLNEQIALETTDAALPAADADGSAPAEPAGAPAAPAATAAPAPAPEGSGGLPAGSSGPAPAAPRRLPLDAVVRVLRPDCPKRPGTTAAEHWGYYRDGMTVAQYLDDRRMDRRRARANVAFDVAHGFVRLEQPEGAA